MNEVSDGDASLPVIKLDFSQRFKRQREREGRDEREGSE